MVINNIYNNKLNQKALFNYKLKIIINKINKFFNNKATKLIN